MIRGVSVTLYVAVDSYKRLPQGWMQCYCCEIHWRKERKETIRKSASQKRLSSCVT